MSTAEVLPEVTFEEFLHGEVTDGQRTGQRHEWVAGEVYAMSGGSERHDLMAGLVHRRVVEDAERRGCRGFQQNRLVRLGDAANYPDVVVICPNGFTPDRLFERHLSLVVEVLSRSTDRSDRGEKARTYSQAPSFEVYVLIDPDRRRIEVGRQDEQGEGRLSWQLDTAGEVPELNITVEQLYDQLDATALT